MQYNMALALHPRDVQSKREQRKVVVDDASMSTIRGQSRISGFSSPFIQEALSREGTIEMT